MSRYPQRNRKPVVHKGFVHIDQALDIPTGHHDYGKVSLAFTAKDIKECPSLAEGYKEAAYVGGEDVDMMQDQSLVDIFFEFITTVADRSEGGKNDLDLGPANNGAGRQTPFAHGMCPLSHYRPSSSCY
eukprot:COSAG01_NODE_602_length_14953_cov_60.675980_10_plen_129_part_00